VRSFRRSCVRLTTLVVVLPVVTLIVGAAPGRAAAPATALAAQTEPESAHVLDLLLSNPFPEDALPRQFGDATIAPMPEDELSPFALGAVEVTFELPAVHEIDYVVYAGPGAATADYYRAGLELPTGWEAEPATGLDRPALLITGELEGYAVGLVTVSVGLVVIGAWSVVEGTDAEDVEAVTANATAIAEAAVTHLEDLVAEATTEGGERGDAPSADNLAGTWAGETDEGEEFELDVRDGSVTAVRFAYRCGSGRHFITVLDAAPIDEGQFFLDFQGDTFDATVTGTFSSETVVAGTLTISEEDGCGATLAWSAAPA
jgi:hypothetical protein